MTERIMVVAKKGCRCPRENPGEPVITDSVAIPVRPTAFYIRLVRDGSLIQQPGLADEPKPAAVKKTGKAEKAEKTEKPDKIGGNK